MCGFVGVFEIGRNGENLRAQVLRMSGKIRHRGPDWSGIYCGPRAVLSHERLSIVDPQSGGQPLYSPDGRLVLAVNGEIYNHRELRRELAGEYDFPDSWQKIILKIRWKFKNLTDLDIPLGLIYHQIQNMFLSAK